MAEAIETLKAPGIDLVDLPERTKDYVLARCARGESLADVIREVLNEQARASGFDPEKVRGAA